MKMSDLFNNEDDELTVESGVEAAEEGETLDRIPLPKVEGNVENQVKYYYLLICNNNFNFFNMINTNY